MPDAIGGVKGAIHVESSGVNAVGRALELRFLLRCRRHEAGRHPNRTFARGRVPLQSKGQDAPKNFKIFRKLVTSASTSSTVL